MPKLDDFDLRPGDPGNPRRPSPTPPEEPAERHAVKAPPFESSSLDEPPYDEPSYDEPGGPPRRRVGGRAIGLVVALILAAGLVAVFWLMSRRVAPPEPGTVAETAPAETSAAPEDAPTRATGLEAPLPPLDQSDGFVRQLVGGLSSHPALTAWLATGNLVRNLAAAIENASLGASPSPNLPFLRPREPYRVLERPVAGGVELVPDPINHRRYDLVTEVFTSLDPQATADVYRRLHGLIQEAFAELGYPDQNVDSALAAAIESLLATPIPNHPPTLEQHVNSYHYADPRLEELAPVQKHLLRLGPDNATQVKSHLRRIAAELELGID